jgi:AraC-like DNA-binding protein
MWALPYDWVRRHTAGAVRQGLSFDALMSDSLIDLRYGDNRDVVGPAQVMLLCMNTTLGLEDSAHGLANASIMPCHSALSLRIALGCTTLEAAINAVSRFYGAVSTAARFNLQTEQDLATVSVSVNAPNAEDEIQLEETYLNWFYKHCMYFFGRPMPVVDVMVRDPFHINMGRRHFGIGATVRLGSVTSFRFSRNLLGAHSTNRAGDNVHWDVARLWLDFVQGATAEPGSTAYVGERGFVRLKDIAEQRGVSRATMRRRFQSIDGGFRGARERALVEAATSLLLAGNDSVEAISAELGYADVRNFRRFVKNATGLTPQQVRMRSKSVMSGDDERVLDRLATTGARLSA